MNQFKSYFDLGSTVYILATLGLIVYGNSVLLLAWIAISVLILIYKSGIDTSGNFWTGVVWCALIGGIIFGVFWLGILCLGFWIYIIAKTR